ncbi:MAG: hypothetical protein ACE5HB_04440 [Terriglobia bacterium]
MNKKVTILALALLVGVGTALAGGGKEKTVAGTLVDSKCFLMNAKNAGNDHMTPKGTMNSCGTACAKMGIPVSLLTAEGRVFTIVVPAPQLADHVGREAKVSGMLKEGSLIPAKIMVKAGDEWQEVKLATMM